MKSEKQLFPQALRIDRQRNSHADLPETSRWKSYRLLLLARLKEMYREPEVIFWVFVFPILLALGLGIAFRNKPADVSRIAVVAGPEAFHAMDLLHQRGISGTV